MRVAIQVPQDDTMESFNDRLSRFLNGSPNEIFMTILNSISNFDLEELRAANERCHYKLMFLGAHSVMQTVGEKIFGERGEGATRFYLEHFVDGQAPDRRFSAITSELHDLRNVRAHQWSAAADHELVIDYAMVEGWKRVGTDLHLNPSVFLEQFVAAYRNGGSIWKYRDWFPKDKALVQKYRYLRDWLLPLGGPVRG